MKTLKRISALLLAILIISSFSVTAFADIEIVEPETPSGETGVATTGVLDGTVTVSYTDSSGENHEITGPTGEKPTITPADDNGNSPAIVALDAGKINDSVQQQINSGDDIIQSGGSFQPVTDKPAPEKLEGSNQTPSAEVAEAVQTNEGTKAGEPTENQITIISTGEKVDFYYKTTLYQSKDGQLKYVSVEPYESDESRERAGFGYQKDNTGGYYGVRCSSSIPITVYGDINHVGYTGSALKAGISSVNVDGNITSGSSSNEFCIDADNSTVNVNGNVSNTSGTCIDASNSTVSVTGNVEGTTLGIRVDGTADITVGSIDQDGTVTGGEVSGGINLDSASTDASVTVWKTDKVEGDENVIKKVINYFVALVQPDEGTISSSAQTAKEGDKVYLKAEDGYQIKEAYNGEGEEKAPLSNDNDGKGFYWTIKAKGGTLLSAILEKVKPEPQPESKPVAAVDLSVNAVKFTFDLDGGMLDGETGKVVKWFFPGQTIELPEAPVKDGFTFAGWETEVKGEKVTLQPGEEFTVTGTQSFTALWKEV